MEAGPLSSSLMARREAESEQQQAISDEQIRQLLIFMGTITIVSFVLVIALITVFIAFIWYSRSRLRGCSCHEKELELGGGPGHLRHGARPPGPSGGSNGLHHTVKMFAVEPGQFQLRRSHKNVIVNPLPGTLLHPSSSLTTGATGSTSTSRTDLVEPINQSAGGGVRELDELAEIESGGSQEEASEEPIYAEIKPSQASIKLEKILKAEQDSEYPSGGGGGGGKKKEIEYWQITAKEVVKFRPCTETFIQRE